jgi:hypothetical protein
MTIYVDPSATIKTTAGPIMVERPKLRGATERFASENTLAHALGAEPALSSRRSEGSRGRLAPG